MLRCLFPLILLFAAKVSGLTIQTNVLLVNPGIGGGWTYDERCDVVHWTDRQGRPREAWLVRARGNGDPAFNGGFLSLLVWNNGSVIVSNHAMPNPGWEDDLNGLGGTVNHDLARGGYYITFKKNGSLAQSGFSFTGDHHCVWRVSGRLYDETTKIGKFLDLTVEYVFKDGEDQFQYVITYDCTGTPGWFDNDCRSPYCQFDWDGDRTETNAISGVGFGTSSRFISTNLVTYDYTQPNLIPYTWAWNKRPGYDAEIGYVQSRLQSRHKGGITNNRYGTTGTIAGKYFDYQMNSLSGWKGNRFTWGTPDGSIDGEGRQSGTVPYTEEYSLSVLVDRWSSDGVLRIVRENENIHASGTSLSSTIGSAVLRGPASPGLDELVDYDKPGFDQVYRNWSVRAYRAKAELHLSLAGNIGRPTFVVSDYYAESAPTNVRKNGIAQAEGTDFVCSWDRADRTLWLTFLSDFSGENDVVIEGPPRITGIRTTNLVCLPAVFTNNTSRTVVFTISASTTIGIVTNITLDCSALDAGLPSRMSNISGFTLWRASVVFPGGIPAGVHAIEAVVTTSSNRTSSEFVPLNVMADTEAALDVEDVSVSESVGPTGEARLILKWTDPPEGHLRHILILRNDSGPVTDTPADGTDPGIADVLASGAIVAVKIGPGTQEWLDTAAVYGTRTYYRLFAVDEALNYPAGTDASGEPRELSGAVRILHNLLSQDDTDPAIIEFEVLKDGQRCTIEVFDTGGMLLRSLADGTYARGVHRLEWDGKDSRGRTFPPGVYLIVVKNGTEQPQRSKVMIVR
jgi:hypothetical protein